MDVIDEIVENDNIDESLLQQSPEAIDELDNPIVPELPKTIAGQQLFVYVPNASNDNLGLVEGSYKQRILLTTDKRVLVDIVDGTIQNIYIKQNYAQEITWLKLNDYFKLLQDLINNITSGTTIVDKANKDSEGNVITDTYVSIKPQVFTEEQQAQARENIGAGSAVATMVKINNEFVSKIEFTSDPQTQITTNADNIVANTNSITELEKVIENHIKDFESLSSSVTTINENVTKLQQDVQSNTEDITQNTSNIATNTSSINDIKSKIPNQASSDNQLADKNFVNSSINNIAAFYITKDAQRNAFETHAQLFSATVFYSGGQPRVPTKNDYCIVRKDETQNNATTRYMYDVNGWTFQYIVNDTPLTAEQVAAINSGITDALVQQIGENTSARHTHTNKSLLDTYSQTEANLSDAVAKKHSHNNKSILDATTASFTTEQQTKLAGIEAGANKTVVDSALSTTSTNPVQNKVVDSAIKTVTNALNNKVTVEAGKGLSSNDFTDAYKNKIDEIESGTNVTVVQATGNSTTSVMSQNATTTELAKKFNSGYGTCSTAGSTSAKVVSISDKNWSLKVGTIIGVYFINRNTASNVTLNVNNTGAKNIFYSNANYTGNDRWITGETNSIIYYMYTGTVWVWISNSANRNTDTTPAISNTASGTAAKTAKCTNYKALAKSYIQVIISNSNTAKSKLTLNINNQTPNPPKDIYINGVISSATNYTLPAGSYLVYYDGTNYYFNTNGTIPNNTGLPLGAIIQSAIPLTDAGVHILDGTTISTEGIYSEFVTYLKAQVTAGYNLTCTQAEFDADVAKTGNCGKFVLNETAKTLRLPKITRFVQGLTNLTDIGKSLESGLPNITGYAQSTNGSGYFWEENYSGGAFYPDTTRTRDYRLSDNKATGYTLGFDASKSNTIYGKSTTVQPSATEYPYYIVLATTTKTNVQVNIDKIASDLNLKVDKNSLKLYSHTLHLRGSHLNAILTIYNTTSNLFTVSSFRKWLYDNGFNGTSYEQAMYECSGSTLTGTGKFHGISAKGSATGNTFGFFYSDNSGDHYNDSTDVTSVIDTVVQIL